MTISNNLQSALTQMEMDEVLIQLLEISHPLFASTFRICDHISAITHQGNSYTPWAFRLPLVTEAQGHLPKPTLILDNVTTDISAAIKATVGTKLGRIQVVHKLVTYSHPDTIERGPTTYKIRSLKCTIFNVMAELTLLGVEMDQIPYKKIDPTNFPGAFGVIR